MVFPLHFWGVFRKSFFCHLSFTLKICRYDIILKTWLGKCAFWTCFYVMTSTCTKNEIITDSNNQEMQVFCINITSMKYLIFKYSCKPLIFENFNRKAFLFLWFFLNICIISSLNLIQLFLLLKKAGCLSQITFRQLPLNLQDER